MQATEEKSLPDETSRFPQPGDRMRFLGENGYPVQLDQALKIFKAGEVVTVEESYVGGWETRLRFRGREGYFNSVMFERL